MKNEIKLIVSDVDGTLVTDDKKLDDRFFKILNILEKRNIIFVGASGRSSHSMKDLFKNENNNLYLISDNGSLITADNKISYISSFQESDIKIIIDAYRQAQEISILATSSKTTYVELHPDHDQKFLAQNWVKYKLVDDITKIKDDFVKISMYSKTKALDNYKIKDIQALSEKYQLIPSTPEYTDVTVAENNKGKALERLLKQLDIEAKNTIGFGDYLNDLEFLQVVGKSFAVENSHPQVKALADQIIGSNNNHSVVKKIISLLDLDI